MNTMDIIQDHLMTQEWYQNMDLLEKIDVLESFLEIVESGFGLNVTEQKSKRWSAEARLIMEKEKSRKLYHACHKAFLWHCGNGSEQAEKDCMKVLEEAIELYNNGKF